MLDRTPDPAIPMAAKEKTFYADLGRRIADQRKARKHVQERGPERSLGR